MSNGVCVGDRLGHKWIDFAFGMEEVVVRIDENNCGFVGG